MQPAPEDASTTSQDGALPARLCGNCEAPLAGPFCSQCGQRAHESARSLGTLLHDAWHVLAHVDGRFWLTLGRLVLRPGFLTQEYFRNRRVRYLGPFQLYIVVSVLFFSTFALVGRLAPSHPIDAAARAGEKVADLSAWQGVPPEVVALLAATAAVVSDAGERWTPESRLELERGCARAKVFESERLDRALVSACQRTVADGGRGLRHTLGTNVARSMFLFLPIMAVVMMALHRGRRRLYVEHLVFFLHAQAAVFLFLTLRLVLDGLGRSLPALDGTAWGLLEALPVLYAGWYAYRSMRVYYGEERRRTLLEFLTVSATYLVLLGVTLGGAFVVSALAD